MTPPGILSTTGSVFSLLLSILVFGLATSWAQDLGELARQQRERLPARSLHPPHIYTNEDLARERILQAADQERIEAVAPVISSLPAAGAPQVHSASSPAPAIAMSTVDLPASIGEAAVPVVAPAWPAGTPLGDVARFYRQRKQWRTIPEAQPVVANSQPGTGNARPRSSSSHAAARTASGISPKQPARKPKRIFASTAPGPQATVSTARVIRVSVGDSLWKIASYYLGDGNQWRAIAAANPQISNPDRIHAGQQILLPGESAAPVAQDVRVQAGDSLWKLAKARWGNGQAWSCITEANPQITQANRIYPGQVLAVPQSCSRIS